MALTLINPLSYQHYVNLLGNEVQQIVNIFEAESDGGWLCALHRYQFEGINYIEGQDLRNEFHNTIINTNNIDERIVVANDILQWGNMLPLNENMASSLDASLNSLDNEENLNFEHICVDRIASISKVYEMWDPAKWIIYDSYCAKGLQQIVSYLWHHNAHEVHDDLLRFPWPPGRVGAPVNGFPRLGTERQAKLGFVYASWLCRAIANTLNQNQEDMWQAFHVEMVAFQLGHEV